MQRRDLDPLKNRGLDLGQLRRLAQQADDARQVFVPGGDGFVQTSAGLVINPAANMSSPQDTDLKFWGEISSTVTVNGVIGNTTIGRVYPGTLYAHDLATGVWDDKSDSILINAPNLEMLLPGFFYKLFPTSINLPSDTAGNPSPGASPVWDAVVPGSSTSTLTVADDLGHVVSGVTSTSFNHVGGNVTFTVSAGVAGLANIVANAPAGTASISLSVNGLPSGDTATFVNEIDVLFLTSTNSGVPVSVGSPVGGFYPVELEIVPPTTQDAIVFASATLVSGGWAWCATGNLRWIDSLQGLYVTGNGTNPAADFADGSNDVRFLETGNGIKVFWGGNVVYIGESGSYAVDDVNGQGINTNGVFFQNNTPGIGPAGSPVMNDIVIDVSAVVVGGVVVGLVVTKGTKFQGGIRTA